MTIAPARGVERRPSPARGDNAPTQTSRIAVLDGLRALGIALVIAQHAGLLAGGGFGVSVFFVLSGFLITSILLRPNTLNRRGLLRFYARRLMRLYPPLLALCAFCAVFALLVLDAHARHYLLAEVGTSVTYSTDFYLGHGRFTSFYGYLGHTWSLAIEEQFYLVWPLLLMLILRMSPSLRARILCVLLLALAVTVWRAHVAAEGLAVQVGLSLDTQGDGLLVGCALAMALPAIRDWLARHPRLLDSAAVCAVAAILVIGVTNGKGIPWRLAYPLVTFSTAALICRLIVPTPTPSGRLLAWFFAAPPVVFIGRISYSLYLWHPVIFDIAKRNLGLVSRRDQLLASPLLLILIVATSWASYRWIEQPARRLNDRWLPEPTPTNRILDPRRATPRQLSVP
jgi:peptidoglycan/LPS O-acetylase OafA/YrhL